MGNYPDDADSFHRANSAAQAEAVLLSGLKRTSGDQYGVGLWASSDPELWQGGAVQFKLRVTYDQRSEKYWEEVPEAGAAWAGDPQAVDSVYESKGIDVVRRGNPDFLIRSGPKIEIIAFRMLEPEKGPWHPLDEKDPTSKASALAEIRRWWPPASTC